MMAFPRCFTEDERSKMDKCCIIETNRGIKAVIFFVLFSALTISALLWLHVIAGIRGPFIFAVAAGALILLSIYGMIRESILTCVDRIGENYYESER
jgi:hypothetical protein